MTNHKNNIAEIRKRSLKKLIADYGGGSKLAKLLGYQGPSYISQMLCGHREITERSAASIESKLGLKSGWMDRDHRGEGSTQIVRQQFLTPDMIFASIDEVIKSSGGTVSPEKYPDVARLASRHFDVIGRLDVEFLKILIRIAAA